MECIDSASAAVRAAGLHLGEDEEQVALVCDYGGSDLTISVLNISFGSIEVLASECKRDVGGNVIDKKLVEHCLTEFKQSKGVDKKGDVKAEYRLKQACERAKHALSSSLESTVKIHSFHEEHDLEVKITRDKFDELTADQ